MRRRTVWGSLFLIATLSACAGGLASHAQDASRGTRSAAGTIEDGAEQRFFALFLDGQKVGGIDTSVETRDDGHTIVRDRFVFSLQRVNGGVTDEFTAEARSTTEYDADDNLLREQSTTTEAGVVEERGTEVRGGTLTLTYSGPSQQFEKEFALPADFRSSRSVFFELVAAYRADPRPVERQYSSFASSEQRFEKNTMRLEGTREVQHGERTLQAYEVTEVSEGGQKIKALVDENDFPISLEISGTFSARWVDQDPFGTENLAQITSELPVSGVVPNWWELESLGVVIAVESDDAELPALFEDNLYHSVQRSVGPDAVGTYHMHLNHTRPQSPEDAISIPATSLPAPIGRFMSPTPLSQSDDSGIQAMAREIVGGEQNALLAGAKLVTWVHQNLEKKGGVRGSATATEVLAARAGDCTEHAALTVALARASGIPARNVDGIVFVGDAQGQMMAGYHAWAEIWVGHWVAVDAVFPEVGTTARYLAFGYNEPGEIGAGASLSRTMGKMSVRIDGYKLFGREAVDLGPSQQAKSPDE